MRSALGILVATSALAVVPGDFSRFEVPGPASRLLPRRGAGAQTGSAAVAAGGPEARARAACEAGLAGAPRGVTAIPRLIELLADDAHIEAIDCGGEWSNRSVMHGGDASVPCGTSPALEAARALGRLGRPASAPLLAALRDPRAVVRVHAARAVAWSDDPATATGATSTLISLLADPEVDVRRAVAGALGVVQDEQAAAPLVRTLKDHDPRVRASVVAALGGFESPAVTAAIGSALKDAAPEVRAEAARSLGAREEKSAVEDLAVALRDDDVRVRQTAAWALGQLEAASAITPLTAALRDAGAAGAHPGRVGPGPD